jgi:hypothetical protein
MAAALPNAQCELHRRQGGTRMDSPTTYFHWGFILISLPNLVVIVGMLALFAVALVAPFPHGGKNDDGR